jgi:hypothetical protein
MMSGGTSCKCSEGKKPVAQRAWVVDTYGGNNSAFNGYRFQSSDYSAMRCTACGACWRTKANYVATFVK